MATVNDQESKTKADILGDVNTNVPAGENVQQQGEAAPDEAVAAAKGATHIEKITPVDNAIPAAKVEMQGGQMGLKGTHPYGAPNPFVASSSFPGSGVEGEAMTKILTAMGYGAPETPEEKAKREKNEKWEKILSAVGDGVSAMAGLYFAGQTGISNYSAEHSMSKKTKDRWDKLNKDREANQKAYADAYFRVRNQLGQEQHWRDQMAMQQQEFAFKQEQAKQQQANFDAKFKFEQEQAQKNWDRLAANDKQAQDNWEKTFNQRQEQITFQQEQAKKEYKLARQRLASQNKDSDVSFLIGDNETIKLPKTTLNTANVSYLFNTLPADVRASVHGQKVYNNYGIEMGEKPLTSDEMLTVVFANVNNSPATADALRVLSGGKPKNEKPTNPKDLAL